MGSLLLDTVLFLSRHKPDTAEPGPTLMNAAGTAFARIDESTLERYFDDNPVKGDTSETKSFVFLPMVSNFRILPVLSIAYELDQNKARLQVILFIEEGVKTHGPRAFGYRYEAPEGDGKHNFWHAQPILEVKLHDETMRALPGFQDDWRPPDTPAFPLDAQSVVDLIVCLMVSLYGLKEAGNMQANGFENRLGASLGNMRSTGA